MSESNKIETGRQDSEPQTPCEILCEWAWSKVNLGNLQREAKANPSPDLNARVVEAIHAFQHALRKKKQLDNAYLWHHELLEMFAPIFSNQEKQLELL